MKTNLPILVLVDDDPDLLEVLVFLFDGKFEIFSFSDPHQAVEFLKNSQTVSFLITDMEMPKMNGLQLLRETRRIWPDLPSLLLTGNHGSQLIPLVRSMPRTQIALKPIDLMVLERMVMAGAGFNEGDNKTIAS